MFSNYGAYGNLTEQELQTIKSNIVFIWPASLLMTLISYFNVYEHWGELAGPVSRIFADIVSIMFWNNNVLYV